MTDQETLINAVEMRAACSLIISRLVHVIRMPLSIVCRAFSARLAYPTQLNA